MDYLDKTDDANLSINIEIEKYNRLKIKSDESIEKIIELIEKDILSIEKKHIEIKKNISNQLRRSNETIKYICEIDIENGRHNDEFYIPEKEKIINNILSHQRMFDKAYEELELDKFEFALLFFQNITKYNTIDIYLQLIDFDKTYPFFKYVKNKGEQNVADLFKIIIESIQQKALIYEKLKYKTLEKENAELKIRLNDMDEKLKLLTTSKFM